MLIKDPAKLRFLLGVSGLKAKELSHVTSKLLYDCMCRCLRSSSGHQLLKAGGTPYPNIGGGSSFGCLDFFFLGLFSCVNERAHFHKVLGMASQNPLPTEDISSMSSSLAGIALVQSHEKSGEDGQTEMGKVNVAKAENHNSPGKLEKGVGGGLDLSVKDVPGKVEVGKIGQIMGASACDEGNVCHIETQRATGILEQHVARSECENYGTERQIDLSESERYPTKAEGGKVGKTEGQDAGEMEKQNAPEQRGKLEETVEGKAGKLDRLDNYEQVPRIGTGKLEKTDKLERDTVGKQDKAEMGKGAKVLVENKGGEVKPAEKKGIPSSRETGYEPVKCLITLAAKSPQEAEYIDKLRGESELKLPDGAELVPADEVTDPTVREAFGVDLFLKNLHTSQFGRFVLYSPLIPSTHTLLSQNFHKFPQGAICVAGAQLQGRGRAGNVWQSPKGCLMFSFTLKMTNGRLVPFLQYVASLAVIEGFEESCRTMGAPVPEVRIKWPNDLYANGVKIGGVLCTSTYSAKTFNIVVGVGLNVGNREPTTCLDALIQELDIQAHALQHEELLASIMAKFEYMNNIVCNRGFSPLENAYYNKWMHSGQTVVLQENEVGSLNVVSNVPVTIHGLTATGHLLATDESGEQYELHPDGNSFDFLKGLVRRKLSR